MSSLEQVKSWNHRVLNSTKMPFACQAGGKIVANIPGFREHAAHARRSFLACVGSTYACQFAKVQKPRACSTAALGVLSVLCPASDLWCATLWGCWMAPGSAGLLGTPGAVQLCHPVVRPAQLPPTTLHLSHCPPLSGHSPV